MKSIRDAPVGLVGLTIALAAAVFVMDLLLPLGVAAGVPYVAVVLVSLNSARRNFTVIVTLALAALIVVGYLLSAPPGVDWIVLANRFLALFAVGATAILALGHTRLNDRHREIVRAALDAIVTIDDRGIVTDWNPQAERIFGWSRDEAVGRVLADLVIPEADRQVHREGLKRFLATGEGPILNRRLEVTALRRGEESFPVELTVTPIRLPGRRFQFSAFVRDISERRQAEELREYLAAIVESSDDAIMGSDLDGNIVSWNAGAEKMFGYGADEVVGRPISIVFLPDRSDEATRFLEQFRRGESIASHEAVRMRRDGSPIDVWLTVSPIRNGSGRILGASAIARDISEKKRMIKELQEKTQELEVMIYVTSHDLRSPLVNVQGFGKELGSVCDSLRSRLAGDSLPVELRAEVAVVLEEEIPEALNYIRASAAKMDLLLNGLLMLSRLGRDSLSIQTLDTNEMLHNIVWSMEYHITQAAATVEVADLPACEGDEVQINQLFSNLLDNALKYLDPARPGVISVSGRVDGNWSVYCVEDNGIGIRPEHQERIFEVFHRLDPFGPPGEGLGLTIVQRVLNRNNGRIRVESEYGRGTKFSVTLPHHNVPESKRPTARGAT